MADNISNYLSTPEGYVSPEQLKATQEYARALMTGSGQQPVHHWTQGVSNMVNALVGGLTDSNAFKKSRASQDYEAARFEQARQQQMGNQPAPQGTVMAPGVPYMGGPFKQALAPEGDNSGADPVSRAAAITAQQESGGNYNAIGPATRTGDKAYGKYQVMGANIPSWTQETLGRSMTPQEFLASPEAQEAVYKAKMGQYIEKYGPRAGAAWFAGEGGMNNPNAQAHRPDGTPFGPTVAQYGGAFANKFGNQAPSTALAFDGTPSGAQSPAVGAISSALAARSGAGAPTAPIQRPDPASGQPLMIDPRLINNRQIGSREMQAIVGSNYLPKTAQDAMIGVGMAQGQSQAIPVPGGNVLVNPAHPGVQQFFPDIQKGTIKAGSVEIPTYSVWDQRLGGYREIPMYPPGTAPGVTAGPRSEAPAMPTEQPKASAEGGPSSPANASVKVASTDPTAGIAAAGTTPQTAQPPAAPATPLQKFAQGGMPPQGGAPSNSALDRALTLKRTVDQMDVKKSGEEESAKKGSELAQKGFDEITGQAAQAANAIPALERMKMRTGDPFKGTPGDPRMHFGAYAGAKDVKARYIDPLVGNGENNNAPNEAFDKDRAALVLSEIKPMLQGTGQVRLAEIHLLNTANADRNLSQAANQAILEVTDRSLRRSVMIGDMANQYQRGQDVVDPVSGRVLLPAGQGNRGADAQFKQIASQFAKDHPMFTDEEVHTLDRMMDLKSEEGKKGKGDKARQPTPDQINELRANPQFKDSFKKHFPGVDVDAILGGK
jgi:hypothetical protein